MSTEKYTKDQIIQEIKRIYDDIHVMNTVAFKEYNKLGVSDSSVNYIFHKYGGLMNLCKELNIPFTRGNSNNHEDLISDILKVYEEHGKLSTEIYSKYGKYSVTCVKSHFNGSFNNMLKQLGLPINMHKKVSKDDIKNDVLNFYKKYNTTSSNKYRKHGEYSECTINKLFGTWKNLMEELNLPYLGETYGYDEVMRQVESVYNKYGFISKTLIDEECDFTYQALSHYFKNKEEISKALNVENAFCDSLSAKAKLTHKILIILFGKEHIHTEKTWDWLRNPETNRMLPVDFYIDFLNIAIEYDGSQHSEFVERFHKTEENFYKACERDRIKDQRLYEHGVKLIRIPYDANITTKYINMLIINELTS